MATKSQGLRRLMQDNESLVRLEKHVIAEGVDFRHNLDSAFGAVGLSPRLVIPELASIFTGPQGSVLHIPLQVTESGGGRRSLFALGPGQETVAGFYVVGSTIFERRVIKRDGIDDLRIDDAFTERIIDATGAEVQTHAYTVSAIGSKTGAIYFKAAPPAEDDGIDVGDVVNTGDGWCWFCNFGTQWWCGFPCLPGELGDIFV